MNDKSRISLRFFVCIFSLPISSILYADQWLGNIASELRYFPQSALSADQYENSNLSLSAQLEYNHQWDNRRQSFVFVPFARVDQHDNERSHIDIRELAWIKAARNWELRLGIRKVFWGVTESQHLVDVINQTDLVEHIDGEDKLGQPMVNLALIRDWGTLDFFILPWFRERTFPSDEGRLLGNIPIDSDKTLYESGAKEKHVDWAVRWEQMFGDWEIGLSHFSGTNREPQFNFSLNEQGKPTLIPYYEQMNQTGIDLQITKEEILWKFELISRKGQADRYTALTGGFEYTFVGAFDSDVDIGVLTEYLFDDRQDSAPTPFEDDIMAGMRLTMNDVQSTELLSGVIFDLDGSARSYLVEASRRLGDNWKLSFEAYFFSNIPKNDPNYGFRHEDFLRLELAWFF